MKKTQNLFNLVVAFLAAATTFAGPAGRTGAAPLSPAQPRRAAEEASAKEVTNSMGMKLMRISPGEFVMGAGDAPPKRRDEWHERDWDEAPAHKVTISKPFYMGATEVTNSQYEQFDPEHKELRRLHGMSTEDDHPVVMVSWQQAVDFCNWLSKQEGRPYRLPTEAEWEYACRAGTTTPYHTGQTLTPEQANFGVVPQGKRPGPVPVGSFPPNAWGLYDVHGNVAEWCLDWYGPYEAGEQTDPVGRADGWARVARGWSYQRANHKLGTVRYCRSSNRSGFLPEDANRTTGFRVVLGELPETRPLPVAEPPVHQQNVRQGPPPKAGPDPAIPYYEDLSRDLAIPADTWGPIFAQHNHFSAITVCPNGDVLAAWYSTVAESGRECAQAATRLRAPTGQWDPPSFFFGTPDCNTHAPVLLSDGQRLYHFCTQSLRGWDDAAECMRTSDDNGATWSRPRIILTREHPLTMSQPCSAFVARNGKLVLAVDGDLRTRDQLEMILAADRRRLGRYTCGGDTIGACLSILMYKWEATGEQRYYDSLKAYVDYCCAWEDEHGYFPGHLEGWDFAENRMHPSAERIGGESHGMFFQSFGAGHTLNEFAELAGHQRLRQTLIRTASDVMAGEPNWHQAIGLYPLMAAAYRYSGDRALLEWIERRGTRRWVDPARERWAGEKCVASLGKCMFGAWLTHGMPYLMDAVADRRGDPE